MKKRYGIQHSETYFDATVEIDHDKADPHIKEAVQFWGGWETVLDNCRGDYTRAFLKNLGVLLVRIQVEHQYNVPGAIAAMGREEGYPPMDGSYGITLVAIDPAAIHPDDIYISEVAPT